MSHARDVSKFVKFITDDYRVAEEFIDSDNLAVSSNKSLRASTGTRGFNTPADLPANARAGSQGFVGSNNRLYISNGSGWYSIALINRTPYWITQPNGSYTLDKTGQSTVITILGGDSDGADVPQYTATGDSNFNAIATVTKDSDNGRVFIVSAIDSEGSASPTSGTGTLTFTLTDGKQSVLANSTFSIDFGPDWSASPTESIVRASDAAASDFYGGSVAISGDGNYAIAGAERNDDGTTDTGSAYILTRSGSTWTQQAKITAGDIVANDYFGRAASMNSDGTYAVIGKPRISGVGQAYIFVRSGSTWTQQQKLTQNGSSDMFGNSVSISSDGNYAAIGAHQADGSGRGAVYIYSRSGSTWTMQQKLTSSDRTDFDRFAYSVSINSDGTYVIATAYGDADNGTNSGSAYIFTRSGSTWTQQAKIKPSDGSANADFGGGQYGTPGVSASINSDGTHVIVGSFYKGELDSNNVGQQRTGAAYVFTRSGSTWTQQQKLSPSAIVAFTYFGQSVSINSDATFAIIGAHGDATAAGAAYVFSRSGSTWTLERKITASDAQVNDYFGLGVSLSSDAAYAIVGSIYEDGGSGDPITNSGAAYIYEAG